MFLVGKNEAFFETLPISNSLTWRFKMTKGAVAFLAGFEMTLQTSFFARATKGIIYFIVLAENQICTARYNRSFTQWLPTWRQTGRNRL
jgi:hypothetical protein